MYIIFKNVVLSHHNKPLDILELLERKNSIEIHVSCPYLHTLSKIYFTVLACSPTGLSSLQLSRSFLALKLDISHNKGKQAIKVLRN